MEILQQELVESDVGCGSGGRSKYRGEGRGSSSPSDSLSTQVYPRRWQQRQTTNPMDLLTVQDLFSDRCVSVKGSIDYRQEQDFQ